MKKMKFTLILTLALTFCTAFRMADLNGGWWSTGAGQTVEGGWWST